MATQITASLPTLDFPIEADYPTQEDWAAFSAAAELNFGILGGSWSTQMQLWKTEANAMSTELNNNADLAQSIANYQGDWISQGYTLGQSVSVSGVYYICKLTHSTGQNPTSGGSLYWNLALGNWNLKVDKVTSTDNAIPKFNGITGEVQNSGVIIDDNNNIGIGAAPSVWHSSSKIIENPFSSSGQQSGGGYFTSFNAYQGSDGNWRYKSTDKALRFVCDTDGAYRWQTALSGAVGNPITWTSNMILNNLGNLNIYGSSPKCSLNENLSATSSYYICYGDSSSSNTYIQSRSTSTGSNPVFKASVAGSDKAVILDNGTFQSATNVYGSTSDIKLKENVVDTTPKLDKLMQVQVRNFNYIGQEEKQIGVVAQEVEQIFPSIVFETKDTKQVEVIKTRDIADSEGNITQEEYTEFETQETGEVTKNVKYSVIYMMMLKGMQEQNEIIKDLKARIEVLEGAING